MTAGELLISSSSLTGVHKASEFMRNIKQGDTRLVYTNLAPLYQSMEPLTWNTKQDIMKLSYHTEDFRYNANEHTYSFNTVRDKTMGFNMELRDAVFEQQ